MIPLNVNTSIRGKLPDFFALIIFALIIDELNKSL